MSRRTTLDEEESISTPNDKHVGGLPRHYSSRLRETELESGDSMPRNHHARKRYASASVREQGALDPRPPAVWNAVPTFHDTEAPKPIYGAFPKGFLRWAIKQLGVPMKEIIHLCSGTLTKKDVAGGFRVDIREDARPDLVADARDLPIKSEAFSGALIDPPYSLEYADELYGTEYPRPAHLLREASRVVRPCGRIGILHFLVPSPPKGTRILSVTGVTLGVGNRIRAFTIYEKEQDALIPNDESRVRESG